ncbi:MAG: NnrU family protein [Caulobacteraceae bacterium]
MSMLIAAAAAFVLLHLLVSGTRVRDALTGAIGPGPYMGLFSLASIVLLVWLIIAFIGAKNAGPVYWGATPVTRWIQIFVQLVAFLLVVPGITTRNPTSVRMEGALEKPDAARGMVRITRHPFLWGVAIWAAGHLMVRGDPPSFLLFGSLLFLSVIGAFSIDAKRARTAPGTWPAFAAATSSVPFAAILQGRQKLVLGEIGAWRIGLALVLWALFLAFHTVLFGVSPMP